MSILAGLKPDKPYDRTEAALRELPDDQRQEVLDALMSGKYTYGALADVLTKHTSETLDPKCVSAFKEKYLKGKANL